MIAALSLAPTRAGTLATLQVIATALQQANEVWLRSQLEVGRRPPVRLVDAMPPWAPRRVRYVPSHGPDVGVVRLYQDGPAAMAKGEATCVDIAAYDAAASTVLRREPQSVVVLPVDPTRTDLRCHAWQRASDGNLIDPVRSFAEGTTPWR
jgi:hypothetical protein